MSDPKKPWLKSVPSGRAASDPAPQPTEGSTRERIARQPTAQVDTISRVIDSSDAYEDEQSAPALPPLPGTTGSHLPRRPRSSERHKSVITTAEFAVAHPAVRKKFGRYELLMRMGSGGMANLYLARIRGPKKFEKLVAVKKIHEHLMAESEFVAMFRDEARIAALIHHPNVVSTFDLGEIDNAYFIAMEYVHGQTFKDVLNAGRRREDPLHWSHAARIIAEVAKGLHAAHELRSHKGEPMDVIHRDVSPQNVLISYDGHVKLVDFGVAFAAEKLTITAAGTLKGKVSYMSPEQTSGVVIDRRSDIFALGAVLFESVCHQRLFKAATEAATLLQVRAARVPPIRRLQPDLPVELENIVHRTLALDRDERFSTAEDLAESLEELLVLYKSRVGRKELAGLMEDLFYERRKIKDRMVRRALVSSTDTPLQGVEALDEETSSVVLTQPRGATAVSVRSLPPFVYITGTAGVLLMVGLALLLLWPKDSSTGNRDRAPAPAVKAPPGPDPTAKAMARPRPRPRVHPRPATMPSVMLTIRVSPKDAKATIRFRHEVQQGPIFQAVLPSSDKRELVTITAKGYHGREVPIVLSQALSVPVELLTDQKGRPRGRRASMGKATAHPRRRPMSMLLEL
ncbi:MAG: serine/threonine-protein kinase [bacterium]